MRFENPARPLLFTLFLLLAPTACEDARVDGGGTFVGPAPRLPDRPPSAIDAAPPASGVLLRGRVETDEGTAIIGRPIAVVDARGKRTEVLSDEGGAFYVADVVRPYDLTVASAPSGSPQVPTVYLGLTREDPFVELFEREGPSLRARTQLVRIGVKPPPCAATCSVSVVTVSQTGGGASSASYAGEEAVVFDIEHAFDQPSIAPGETIDVHVLAIDAAFAKFAYARREGIRAESGDLTELGFVVPEPVASTAPLTLRAVPRGVSASWTTVLGTSLELPGGGTMQLTYDAAAERTLQLPLVPGAGVRATAWMQHPPLAERPYFRHATQVWTGTRPLAGGAIDFEMRAGPVPVRPAADEGISARGPGITWTNPAGARPPLSEVTVSNVARGALLYRVWTTGEQVSFARMERLGLPRLAAGDHELGLTSTPEADADEVVDPDARVRHRRFDPRTAGSSTAQGFRFRVTR
jgi:hypothetical protein